MNCKLFSGLWEKERWKGFRVAVSSNFTLR
jgi:hypothetical protein